MPTIISGLVATHRPPSLCESYCSSTIRQWASRCPLDFRAVFRLAWTRFEGALPLGPLSFSFPIRDLLTAHPEVEKPDQRRVPMLQPRPALTAAAQLPVSTRSGRPTLPATVVRFFCRQTADTVAPANDPHVVVAQVMLYALPLLLVRCDVIFATSSRGSHESDVGCPPCDQVTKYGGNETKYSEAYR